MTTIHVPSGAVAILDLEDIPEETIERLRARQALTVQFHNPRRYRVYTTPDGFEVRVIGRRARAKRLGRHLTLAAAVALVGGTLVFRLPDFASEPVEYVTTTGETIRLQGDHATVLDTVKAPTSPRIMEAVVPPTPSPSAKTGTPSPTRPGTAPRAATPTLPAKAAERATIAVREAPARKATRYATRAPVAARASVEAVVDVPAVGGLGR